MKTTIIVDDGGLAALDSLSATGSTLTDRGASLAASIDAGAAPIDGVSQRGAASSSSVATDGGPPPSWLLEAIAQAGGLAQTSSSEGDDVDAGFAPA